MHRIDTLTAVKDKFGPGKNGFTDGNIRTGRLATWLNSAMWDAIQEEICGVIEKAGIELNKEEHDQLYKAILLLVGGAINEEALLIKNNLSDVEDKDEAVENLGLKPTVDKAKNAVQRDGDTMTGELKIRGVNALRIFNEAFGLIFRRSEESLHLIPTQENQGENGDIGPLRPFSINLRQGDVVIGDRIGIGNENNLGEKSLTLCDSNTGFKWGGRGVINVFAEGHNVFRFTKNGVLALENLSTGNLRKFTLSCDSSSTKSARFHLWGNSSRPVVAELGDDSGWHFYSQRNTDNSITFAVNGQMVPSNYGNFDARYQTKTGGVQDVRLGGAIGIGRGGNAPSGHLISGLDGGESMDWANARPVQVLINGVWRNVASL
ncbi:TPA: phage tail protein [Escherichia coli]|uniref:phage tail protein n=1 Tax=Escherichia coli TaxID=562 RepID=UPI001B4B7D04|nr:phage tail protein [Escherichia coli]MDM4976543.1 phage tail protein [Escherichia coli]MDM4976908.1 phage tail protein [Escherichia coli]MDM5160954.1 phage tail protein [Escherichia coli]GIP85122.1 phage tail fiber [Escherichia coli]HDH9179850.1 phage tail protein [Escherichia coli]